MDKEPLKAEDRVITEGRYLADQVSAAFLEHRRKNLAITGIVIGVINSLAIIALVLCTYLIS